MSHALLSGTAYIICRGYGPLSKLGMGKRLLEGVVASVFSIITCYQLFIVFVYLCLAVLGLPCGAGFCKGRLVISTASLVVEHEL